MITWLEDTEVGSDYLARGHRGGEVITWLGEDTEVGKWLPG